jgi:hypothetical protein
MADQLQLRGGSTAEHSTFTGALREVTVDIDKDTVVVHDNATAGGHPLLREDLSNLPAGTIDNADINASAAIAGTKIDPDFGSQTVETTGVFSAAGGAQATPSITFTGDLNTGIYSPGADQVAVATNGVERLSISSAGEVTTANQKLNLIAVGRGAGALFTNVAIGDAAIASSTTGLYNTAIGTSALRDNTTGTNNSAIGISALISNTIGERNAAAGADALRSNISGNNNSALGVNALNNNTTGSNNTCVGHQAGLLLTTGSNNTIIGNILGTAGLADTVIIGAGTTERLRIDSSGRVGIGTSLPTERLHVDGNVNLEISAANAATRTIELRSNYGGGTFFDNAALALIQDNAGSSGGSLQLRTTTSGGSSPTTALTIDSSQRVGIGTASPGAPLAVATASDTADLGRTGLTIGGSSTLTSGDVLMLNFTPIGANSNRARAGVGCVVGSDWGKGNLTFYTLNASSGAAMTSAAERMRITDAGLVGIGTSSPSGFIHIQGTSTGTETYGRFTTGSASGDQSLVIKSGSSRDHMAIQVSTNAGAADDLALQPDGGNVGIGTTSPAYKLVDFRR